MQRSMSSASLGSVSTSSGTMVSKSEVLDGTALTASPPSLAAPAPTSVEVTANQAKERLSGWGVSVGSFFASRAARFSAQKLPSPSASTPSSSTGSPVLPPQEVSLLRNSGASMTTSPTGDAKLIPPMIQTPPQGGPLPAADLGEKTPRGNGFSPDGDVESREITREHEEASVRYDGDSDEEPSFGVAL